jgi:bacteriophage N4 adsorption protein B
VVTAYLFAFFGLDDLLFDVSYWVYTLRRWLMKRKFKAMTVEQLRASEQQRIAIFVPCWHEEDVVEKMTELTSRSIQYQNYTLFIGVYPNDPATIERAQSAAKRFKHVHVAVNEEDGPTTKGQNLNQIYRAMREIEGADPFKIIVMHDVEDVVHPNSMVVYNHLIPRFDMVQIPVFPLEREWHKATAWTYADEFAENHLKDLVIREAFGSFVPSAGVGCAFNRAALAAMAGDSKDLFPTNSLTEDYQVGLRLQENGYSTIMVHQRLAHGDGETYKMTAASFVATREFFPDTFKTAVRQKTRWIAGICFQAWAQTGWTGDWFTRYTLYRDRKAIVTNMLVLSGYAVLGGSLSLNLWHWLDHRVFLPEIGTHWWQWAVLNFVFCLTILRLMQKAYFVSSLYGSKQGVLALARVPWGAVINAFATARACYVVANAAIRHESISWSKTAHAFPTDSALHEYRRQLGEVLIEEAVLTSEELAAALGQRHEGERLGETLVRLGFLSERELVGALAVQMGAEAGDNDDLMPEPAVLASIGEHDARRLRILPLRLESDRVVVAVDDEPSTDTDAFLNAHLPQPYRVLLVSHRELTHALDRAYTFSDERRKPLGLYLLEKGYLSREKLEEVLAEQDKKHKPLFELVVGLHLLTKQQIAQVVEDYFKTPYVHPPHGAALASDAIGKIPAVLLRDNVLALYEVDGMTFVASPFPLWGALRESILDALGAEVHIVAVDAEELIPLRRRLRKEIEKRRRLGEVLVDDELVSNEDIALALEERLEGEQLGETLVRLGFLSERDLTGVLARQFGVETAATEDLLPDAVALDLIGPEAARHWRILPLRIEDEKVVVAADSEPSAEADAFLRDQLAYPYRFLLVGRRELTYALKRCYGFTDERRKPLGLYLLDLGFVTRHDLDDALNHQDRLHKPLFELLAERHVLTLEQIAHVTNDYFKMPFVRPDHRAHVPTEVVRRIPARLLTESGIVVYESEGSLYVAGHVPPGGPVLDAILKAIGEEATVVAAPAASLDPLRKKMLHDAGQPDVEEPENLSPAP